MRRNNREELRVSILVKFHLNRVAVSPSYTEAVLIFLLSKLSEYP